MKRIAVLLVDDHTILREGLRALLELETDMEVIGEAVNGYQAIAFANKLAPDVVVMDLAMPLLNGIDAIAQIRECTPASTKILVLSAHDDAAYIQQARALGASGYLVKQNDAQILATAVREIHQGNLYFKPIQPTTLQSP